MDEKPEIHRFVSFVPACVVGVVIFLDKNNDRNGHILFDNGEPLKSPFDLTMMFIDSKSDEAVLIEYLRGVRIVGEQHSDGTYPITVEQIDYDSI